MAETWSLSRLGREYYRVEITTNPVITDWDISFDQGVTWEAMTYDSQSGYMVILVSGPDFTPEVGDVAPYTELATSVMPYIRATDQPEVLIRTTPRIELV